MTSAYTFEQQENAAPSRSLKISARVFGYPPTHNAGSEWMLHSMLHPLVDRGHQATVWLSHPGELADRYEIDGVHVVPYQKGINFAAEIRDSDVLISHYENVPVMSAMARDYGIPLVTICHDNFPTTFHNASGADLIVYNSEWIRKEGEIFYARYPRDLIPQRTITVRPPVFSDHYRTRPGDCVTLVNLNADKGGEIFWKIAAWMPEWNFLGVMGSYGEQVQPPMRLSNCDVVKNIPGESMREKVYGRSRVVLMPSIYESWGRVAVEAFASGIPVIAHPTPGLVESMGSAGIYAYRDDLNAWTHALRALRDPAAWSQASRRAFERSAQLDASNDLGSWFEAVESLRK
ncbi:glycosyltransferase family 4 protein [Streptomyces goshikiensis]|uniref:glycosyltransferase family 4 protein n=1 Tax=Streptomyces goshikiensis TaxID=1942 RepID=UPI003696EE05